MKNLFIKIFIFSIFIVSYSAVCSQEKEAYKSKSLIIRQLTPSTFMHISYLQTENFGNVACNGMIVIRKNEALVFDTPTTNQVSEELINYLRKKNIKVIGVVTTHFHEDCLGGLNAFHKNKIPSFATFKTIAFSKEIKSEVPQNGFENSIELKIKDTKAICYYFGEGHTKDNCVAYFPDEKALFGGCLIKEIDATKGYLGDANVKEWSNTVAKVKSQFPDLKVVIPGHGKTGNQDLLNYTIQLFKTSNE